MVQLGPHPDRVCPTPDRAHRDFCVIDICGQQEVTVLFCGCSRAEPHWRQLMRVQWFPATVVDPRTAVTFNLLRHFHLLTLQSKITAYDFYGALCRGTNNSGLNMQKVCSDCFS